jgi:hypothetical protein
MIVGIGCNSLASLAANSAGHSSNLFPSVGSHICGEDEHLDILDDDVCTEEANANIVDFGFGDEHDENFEDNDGSSLFALLELIGEDADKAINLVTEAADSNDVLDLVIEGVWDESE